MTGNRTLGALVVFVLLVTGASSCSKGTADPVVGEGRTAAVYQAILDWMVDEEPRASTIEPPKWVWFVAARSEEQIDLDVQVAVVEALELSIFVRFIDERSEAVAEDSDGAVRDDGLLVGLGAVEQEGDTVEVYVDRYRDISDVEAWLVTLRRAGDAWQIIGSPVRIDVRPLPIDT